MLICFKKSSKMIDIKEALISCGLVENVLKEPLINHNA